MASIVGEKYYNATASDIASIDAQIALHQTAYDEAVRLKVACMSGVLDNPFYSCHKRLGRSLSNITEDVMREKAALSDLKKQRELLVSSIEQTSQLQTQTAQADKESASADAAVAETRGKQFAIYGGIAIVLIIGGLIAYKMLKKKK